MTTALPEYDALLQNLKQEPAIWSEAQESVLLDPYRYLISVPGKAIRVAMIDAFDKWLQVPPESLAIVKSIVQQLHTASLLYAIVQ